MRYLHIIAGAMALVTFWTATLLRKGSPRHVAVGRVYLQAMIAVMVSAIPLSVAAFIRGQHVTGLFLLYLILITGTACWTAWRAIRDKNDIARFVSPAFRGLAWLNLAAAAAVFALGAHYQNPVLMGLALVGLINGPAMLSFAKREPNNRRWWLAQHYSGMIGGGVATHIAFLSLGLTRLLPPEHRNTTQLVAWFAPLLLAVVARVWLDRKYQAHRSAAPRAR